MSFNFSKTLVAFVLIFSFATHSFSQERTLGTWKAFMPYANCFGVFDAGDKVYAIGIKSVYTYEKNTGVIQTYDKASGLNDIGVKIAAYDPASHALVIAYDNSNIDIIYNGTDVYNIPEIKNQNSVSAVNINGISFYNGDAYISSDIGITVINMVRKEISNTYIIGANGGQVKVYSAATDGVNIYAATDEGVKHADYNSTNLQNFNNWSLFSLADSLPKKKATYVATFNNKAYAVIGTNNTDTLYEFNGTYWSYKYSDLNNTFSSVSANSNTLYFTTQGNVVTDGKNGKIDASGNVSANLAQHPRPTGWFEGNGTNWEGDLYVGLIKNNNGNIETIVPNGPFSTRVSDLEIENGVLYVSSGGADDIWAPLFIKDGFFVYNNSSWTNYNLYTNPELDTFPGIVAIVDIPEKNQVYLASFLRGLGVFDKTTKRVTIINKDNNLLYNSFFELTSNTTLDTRLSAMAKDKYNNLWICNAGADKAIKLLKNTGDWAQFRIPYNYGLMKKIVIDQNDQLWAPLRTLGAGLLVWSYNQTIDDPSDDVSRVLYTGAGAGGLPDANVYCLAEDKDGNMWVGTEQGIAVFYCAGSVLTQNGCDADQIKVERDGYIGYLFGSESVRAIAVDAANRKWIGTTSGLWLISDDGKKELLKFTTENSPLPDNQITDIAINDITGEVFIGTSKGLVSYQGDAIAECTDCDGALVYPNPVKPDYSGPIAIKGLTENAYVKITDISGTLVYQGKANGSQMIWDGKGYNGARAKTGVYLVFSSTDLGKERKVAKILLTN